MKYLGIDYGAKRVGVAVSDAEGAIAFPRVVLPNDNALLSALARLCKEENIECVIVGDTRTVEGAENPVTADAEVFTKEFTALVGLPTKRVWEGWSSIEASRYAPGDEHNDAAAAAFILQRYLEMHPHGVE